MAKVDLTKYKDIPTIGFKPFSDVILDFSQHNKWVIPSKVAIVAAPVGAFVSKKQNPYQPISADEIIKESIECVEAGACSVHIHVRDEKGFPSGDRNQTIKIVKALRDRFGANVHIDGEALFGETFPETMEPIVEGWYESAAVNCHADFMGDTVCYEGPQSCKAQCEIMQAYGKKPLLAVYNPGDIDNTYRWLIKTGVEKPPFYWAIGPGMPGGAPMYDPISMAETMVYMIRRIKDVDKSENQKILVLAGGRASSYVIAFAILLGCHVRVGKEDTIYMHPDRDDVIKSSAEVVERTVAMARLLGREPMTAAEYRKDVGMQPFK
jgi:3-keto-5-aminohexanoate cleavage enzyme